MSEEINPLTKVANEESWMLEERIRELNNAVAIFEEKVYQKSGDISSWDIKRFHEHWHQLAMWLLTIAPYLDPRNSRRIAKELLSVKERIEHAHRKYLGLEG
jgi:hypothetical protein